VIGGHSTGLYMPKCEEIGPPEYFQVAELSVDGPNTLQTSARCSGTALRVEERFQGRRALLEFPQIRFATSRFDVEFAAAFEIASRDFSLIPSLSSGLMQFKAFTICVSVRPASREGHIADDGLGAENASLCLGGCDMCFVTWEAYRVRSALRITLQVSRRKFWMRM
jgi:hypothetical protein